jgi:hypothetical protein
MKSKLIGVNKALDSSSEMLGAVLAIILRYYDARREPHGVDFLEPISNKFDGTASATTCGQRASTVASPAAR